MRARSYHASPGGCKGSGLCISLWMLSANWLVSCCAAVDERGCGKVDNRRNANPYPSHGPSAVHMRSELSTVPPVSFVFPATGVSFDRLLFRCSGYPAHAQTFESSWLFTVASDRWWLPSLPSRVPSGCIVPSGTKLRDARRARR